MTCPTCGAQVPADAAACPSCGAAAPAAPGGGQPPGGSFPGSPPPGPAPAHASGLPSEVRNWAAGAHLSAFLGSFVALAVLGPLVVWLLRREVDGFSARHAREALNFNLTLLILLGVGFVLGFLTLGLGLILIVPLAIVAAFGWIALTIVAAVRAYEGREYRYPLTIRFVD